MKDVINTTIFSPVLNALGSHFLPCHCCLPPSPNDTLLLLVLFLTQWPLFIFLWWLLLLSPTSEYRRLTALLLSVFTSCSWSVMHGPLPSLESFSRNPWDQTVFTVSLGWYLHLWCKSKGRSKPLGLSHHPGKSTKWTSSHCFLRGLAAHTKKKKKKAVSFMNASFKVLKSFTFMKPQPWTYIVNILRD